MNDIIIHDVVLYFLTLGTWCTGRYCCHARWSSIPHMARQVMDLHLNHIWRSSQFRSHAVLFCVWSNITTTYKNGIWWWTYWAVAAVCDAEIKARCSHINFEWPSSQTVTHCMWMTVDNNKARFMTWRTCRMPCLLVYF